MKMIETRCQFKTSDCQFDSSLIMSHVGQSNVTLALPKHYVFEYESVAIDSEAFSCDRSFQSVFEHDSCYRVIYFYRFHWRLILLIL